MKIPRHDSLAWNRIAPYLDRALELDPRERETWFAELTTTEPEIAQAVRQLISERDLLHAKGFLENSPATDLTTLAGMRVGAYTIERLLGRGGMGEVWLASRNDGRFEGQCALKFLDGSIVSPKVVERFRREGHLLARLTHPNIARLIDAGATDDGKPYLALEYIDGERIDHYCKSKSLSIDDRVRLFIDVVAAVAHAHTHLIIHRDLKPSNVLVTRDGQVKLLDFGIAKLLSAETAIDEAALTRLEEVALTPEYAAPEQMLGETPSTATDVYQLGMLLYVLVTGKHPLQQIGTRAEKIRTALDGVVPRASDLADKHARKKLQGDVDAILAMALRKIPNERYATAQALKEELVRYLNHEPVLARRGATLSRARKFVSRHRFAVVGLAIVVLSLCAMVLFALAQAVEAQQQRDRAQFEAKNAKADRRFMEIMMSEVGESGKPITLEQVLDKGLQVLETQYADDPDFVVRTLIGMSGRFMDLGDRQREYNALTKAETIARQHGNLRMLGKVLCSTVETETALGHVDRAASRLAEGRDTLARAKQVKIDDELDCLRASATLNEAQGKTRDSIRDLEQAVALYEQHGLTSDIGYSPVLDQLSSEYASLGDIRKAYDFQYKALQAVEKSGRTGSESWSAMMHNQAMDLWNMGEARAAFTAETQVLNRDLARNPDGDPPAAVSLIYGRMMTRLDRAAEALSWLDRAQAAAAHTGDGLVTVHTHVARAEALLSLGQFDKTATELNIVADAVHDDVTANRHPAARAQIARVKLLAKLGKLGDARQLIDSVLVQIRDPEFGLGLYLGDAVLTASHIATAQGSHVEAESYASEALQISESRARDSAQSANVGEAALRLAETRLQRHDRDGALVLCKRAVTSLKNSLGADHSLTRAAISFESQLR